MKRTLPFLFVALILLGCGNQPETSIDTESVQETKPYNVLFVSIDDLGPNLGAFGNEHVISPNLDAFASTGMTFRQTFCQAAVCAPSRASLMSGLRPDSTRVWHLGDKFRQLHPNMLTMPMHFHNNGYHTPFALARSFITTCLTPCHGMSQI